MATPRSPRHTMPRCAIFLLVLCIVRQHTCATTELNVYHGGHPPHPLISETTRRPTNLMDLPVEMHRAIFSHLPSSAVAAVRQLNRAAHAIVQEDVLLPCWTDVIQYELAKPTLTAREKLLYLHRMARYASHAKTHFFIPVDETLDDQILEDMDRAFLPLGVTFGLRGNTTTLQLRYLHTLTAMDLSGLTLRSLKELDFPPRLTYLSLKDNVLFTMSDLPPLPFLKTLNLRYNYLHEPKDIVFPPSLETLDLSRNCIESLEGVTFPPFLQELDLSDNLIRRVDDVSFPDTLTALHLQDNIIQWTEAWLGNRKVRLPPRLLHLDISQNPIKTLSPIQWPPSLITLRANHVLLLSLLDTTLPATIEELSLDHNRLTTTKGLDTCPNLVHLSVHHNPLPLVPRKVARTRIQPQDAPIACA